MLLRTPYLKIIRIGVIQNALANLVANTAGVVSYLTMFSMLLLATSFSLIYMTASMAYHYGKVQIFHIPIDFWANVFMISLTQLISLMPIQTFGGLGVREFISLYLYGLFGVDYIDIPAALIGSRILSYLFNLVCLLYVPVEALIARIRSQNKG